ncbi:hypothetical protein [Synechococcus sp. BA-132 BA5]|uniref:hypothetical protein n=1 Tax=Synechococcus sp. BA-132 BA5 TaxID=3110252 RepID=UPI002B21179D|nr:hypothetical protein [Synechococcus sp. BA-132 BA5]MEA5414022.1 hypothetical protein [Synechococcus sp. BA-132 BA5]
MIFIYPLLIHVRRSSLQHRIAFFHALPDLHFWVKNFLFCLPLHRPPPEISTYLQMNESIRSICHPQRGATEAQAIEIFSLGRLLSRIATALFVLFLVQVLADSLPVRILDPAWQLSFSGSLIRNGLLPVLGMLLVPLAAMLDSSSRSLARYRDWLRRWSLPIAMCYLLLIPLQGYGVWKGLDTIRNAQSARFNQASQKFTALRQAINAATSSEDLQARLQALQGPTLPANVLEEPLPELRQRLLAGLEGAENRARNQLIGAPPVDNIQKLILQAVRVALSALILAFAFTAAAHRRDSTTPLLEEWEKAWKQRSLRQWNRARMRKL